MGELIAARAVLGIGAAAIFPMAISVIPVMFGEQERQKAISVMAGALFLSYPIGPIVGGFLLDHFWWGSVFLINVPVVVIALAAVTLLLPESRATKRPRFDFPGIVISSAGLTALTYGFIRAGQDGWTDTPAAGHDRRGTGDPRRASSGGSGSPPGGAAASRSSTCRCSGWPASGGARS